MQKKKRAILLVFWWGNLKNIYKEIFIAPCAENFLIDLSIKQLF